MALFIRDRGQANSTSLGKCMIRGMWVFSYVCVMWLTLTELTQVCVGIVRCGFLRSSDVARTSCSVLQFPVHKTRIYTT